jgi:hypothetical protein
VLVPLLGVAPFFMRRLLDLPSEDSGEANQFAPAALAIAVGLMIDLTFVAELFNESAAIGWIRCATEFRSVSS